MVRTMSTLMVFVYGVLVIGAISSFMNYRLQKKWFDITHKHLDPDYKVEPSVSERKL